MDKLILGIGGIIIAMVVLILVGLGSMGGGGSSFVSMTGETAITDSGGSNIVVGDTEGVREFVLTHYTPCTPEYKREFDCDPSMQGDESMATGGKAVYDPTSPMGFYAEYKGNKYLFSGAVAWNGVTPILPYVVPGKQPKTGVYFDDKSHIFVALDHFGGCASNPKAIDIMATDEGYKRFFDNLKAAGLVTKRKEQNGCSSSPKPVVKGTLIEILSVGGGGGGGGGQIR